MRPRIVILSAFLSPLRSGAEACAEEVALRLSDRFDITIVTARMRRDLPKKDFLQGKVSVIRVGFGWKWDKWLYPLLAPFTTRQLSPDVIHAVLETFAGVALHACRVVVPRAKQILTLQTTNRQFLRRHILRTPDIVTAISRILAEQAAHLGRPDAIVIPNGIPYGEIRSACSGVQKIPGRILFVGRLETMKGVDTLLQAFANVKDPRAHLRVIGYGLQERHLKNMARDLSIEDRVTFTGYILHEQIFGEYAKAQIFCGLSRSEALGNVFIEALAAGCVVIATEVGGITDSIQHRINGLLVRPDAPSEVSALIDAIVATPGSFDALTRSAVQQSDRFDWNGIAAEYGGIYDSLLSRTTVAAR